ncbi:MAG: response regulator [Saprospiraceae bacterium]|nr:response regulator [Saprospiraceae bacterium]MCB9310206.1 response regulator [Lewinellaceae bacterium]
MGSKILVIEDNNDVRDNLTELLELSGYEVESAENGKIGVQKAREFNPDLILCDIMMPELDGYGVLRILSTTPDTAHIPFIFLTAKSEKDDFRKGMGLGADDYITKPYDDVQLLDTITIRLQKSAKIRSSFDKSSVGFQRFLDEAKAQKEFEKLSENRETRHYHKKDLIYEAGQHPKWLYFVESGSVKVYQINDFGKEFTVNVYKQGDFFGYLPLLKEEPYFDNAACLDESFLRLIPIEDFMLLVLNNREFAAKFIKMLANLSEDTEKLLLELAYSSVRKRVANALIKFSEVKESNVMSLLRDDIASMAGTAKETTIRTLSDFKSEGLITIDDKKIEIINIEKLRNMPQ